MNSQFYGGIQQDNVSQQMQDKEPNVEVNLLHSGIKTKGNVPVGVAQFELKQLLKNEMVQNSS